MNLPVDRVDVHMATIGYTKYVSLFAFGKAVGEQIVEQGTAKANFFAPGVFCCSARLVCSKFFEACEGGAESSYFLGQKETSTLSTSNKNVVINCKNRNP